MMSNWCKHSRMTQSLPLLLKTSMLCTNAKRYWHSSLVYASAWLKTSVFHVMHESKKGKGTPNKQFGTPDVLVHTGSPKQKANLFLPSFIKINILLSNSPQTQWLLQITSHSRYIKIMIESEAPNIHGAIPYSPLQYLHLSMTHGAHLCHWLENKGLNMLGLI